MQVYSSVMDAEWNPLRKIPSVALRHLIMQLLAWMWCIVFSLYFGSFLIFGITASATFDYDPNAGQDAPATSAVGADAASGEGFTVKLAHESGLTLGAGHMDVGDTAARAGEQAVTGYAKYSNGGLTVGYQEFYYNAPGGAADTDGDGMAIAYTAGDVTISYSVMNEQTNAHGATAALEEEEISAFQAAYSMGGMTLAASLYETDNTEGVAGVKYEETELSVSFAF